MEGVLLFGALIALVGLLGFAVPSFNTPETRDVVKLGDLKVQAQTEQEHFIPPVLSEGLMALGVLMIGAGLVMNRQ